MIRIVLDTNVFVSALLQPDGLPAEVLVWALSAERVQLCISAEILRSTRKSYAAHVLNEVREKLAMRFRQSERRGYGSSRRRQLGRVPTPTMMCSLNALKPPRPTLW